MFAPVYVSYSNIAGKQEEIEMFVGQDLVCCFSMKEHLEICV